MNASDILMQAVLAALQDYAALSDAVNGIYLRPVERATPPFVTLGEAIAADWSTKTEAGREIRFAVQVHEKAQRADRLDS